MFRYLIIKYPIPEFPALVAPGFLPNQHSVFTEGHIRPFTEYSYEKVTFRKTFCLAEKLRG